MSDKQVVLSRTVRFTLPTGHPGRESWRAVDSGRNSFAAMPSVNGLGVYFEIEVRVGGQPDAQTGYLINISSIDRAVREILVPLFDEHLRESSNRSGESMLSLACDALRRAWHSGAMGEPARDVDASPKLLAVKWNLTPYHSLEMSTSDPSSVLMTQSFEFAASHRLHCPDLDEAANRAIFGKCNNPSGHGHNYRLDVTVLKSISDRGAGLSLHGLEDLVHRHVIERLDHRHLNHDVPEFARLNPSVERIAQVCYQLLQKPIEQVDGRLHRVTVWETGKTRCTYPAGISDD